MIDVDYDNAVAVTREIYWVGFFEEGTRLRCNPFLMIDGRSGDVILFDPGSIPDFPKVMRKVIDVVPLDRVNLIVVSHQDPDVCGNLAVVEDVVDRADLRIAAHTNTIRLIQHLGLRSEFYAVDRNDYRLTLDSGREFEFLYLPFLHSPGAIATYDRQSRSLFSGDLFAAIDSGGSLFGGPNFPEIMRDFHQSYMPSNSVLRKALDRIGGLDLDRILPQHGVVIEGPQIGRAIEFLRDLPCGIDLMED